MIGTRRARYRIAPALAAICTAVAAGGASAAPGVIETALLQADGAALSGPTGVATTADDGYLVADTRNNRVVRVGPGGVATVIAGASRVADFSGDGGSAVSARLNRPRSAVEMPDGAILIADTDNHVVREVRAGIIRTVAGTPRTPDFAGDGGPATQARLNFPHSLLPHPAGGYLIADWNNDRVRRVDAAGTIGTFAGNGLNGAPYGDGGPATQARLNGPTHLARTAAGTLLISDSSHHFVREVDANGVITRVAGDGGTVSDGNGGPALQASLGSTLGIAPTADGGFLVADSNQIRFVSPGPSRGIDVVAAASDVTGATGDGGQARDARLWGPNGIALTPEARLIVADTGNHRVRAVEGPFPAGTPVSWGQAGDVPVPGRYTAGATADLAVYRPAAAPGASGVWYAKNLATRAILSRALGGFGDLPVPADYTGDGRTDYAAWNPANGVWRVLNPTADPIAPFTLSAGWGEREDVPVPGDYDGDGRADFAIWRPSTAVWWIRYNPGPGGLVTTRTQQWGEPWRAGQPRDRPFLGARPDGSRYLGIWRPRTGTVFEKTLGPNPRPDVATQFPFASQADDVAVPARWSAACRGTVMALWRPSTGGWLVAGGAGPVVFGGPADLPAPADMTGDGAADLVVFRTTSGTWRIAPHAIC